MSSITIAKTFVEQFLGLDSLSQRDAHRLIEDIATRPLGAKDFARVETSTTSDSGTPIYVAARGRVRIVFSRIRDQSVIVLLGIYKHGDE